MDYVHAAVELLGWVQVAIALSTIVRPKQTIAIFRDAFKE